MKKKIIAITLAVSAMMSTVAFAENINANYTDNVLSFEQTDENIAIVSCYDENGKLCYSNMYKSEDGNFSADIPKEYKGMKTKVYFVNSKEIKEISVSDDVQPTATPSVTPTETPSATEKPSATTAPTTKPSTDTPSIYEKVTDAVYAPAVVKEVETTTKDGEDMNAVIMLMNIIPDFKSMFLFTVKGSVYKFHLRNFCIKEKLQFLFYQRKTAKSQLLINRG